MPAQGTTHKSDQRREAVLSAAVRCFATKGYFGTTTQEIATEAGISQPYIYRLFRDKQTLFIRVIEYAAERLLAALSTHLTDLGDAADGSHDTDVLIEAMSRGYADLVQDRDLLMFLMQANCAAADPAVADALRHCYEAQVEFVRNTSGASDEQIRAMFGASLLANVALALSLTENPARWARTLSGDLSR